MLHAIVISIYRIYFSRKNLLEWESAYYAEKRLGSSVQSYIWEMLPSLIGISFIGICLIKYCNYNFIYALPLLLGWLASPLIAFRLSAKEIDQSIEIIEQNKSFLRNIAYKTWKYFRENHKEEFNYLIPDNVQLSPQEVIAERTSPTNISLSMLSMISAYELGFEPLSTIVERLFEVFESLKKLEKHHGHLLNWYDIRTLAPLSPRYVSFVDSGNFVGHLFSVKSSANAYFEKEIITLELCKHIENRFASYIKELNSSEKSVNTSQGDKSFNKTSLLKSLSNIFGSFTYSNRNLLSLHNKILEIDTILKNSDSIFVENLKLKIPEFSEFLYVDKYLLWIDSFLQIESSLQDDSEFQSICVAVKEDLDKSFTPNNLKSAIHYISLLVDLLEKTKNKHPDIQLKFSIINNSFDKSHEYIQSIFLQLSTIISECSNFIEYTDFKYIYDSSKNLFPVGYNVDYAKKDNGYYDLLASEARLGSFIAIAKGDVPVKHWFSLGRALGDTRGGKALLSWSGTMFEYLMPLIVMKNYKPTLLSESYKAIVEAQKRYGERKGVPWGVSESAYSGVDFHSTYQYRAFGVPGLGLKRGLENDLVISPYSTVLALPISPLNAILNLKKLDSLGAFGIYGFYEAIDYTKERLTPESDKHIVRSFFAHHQGMSLISITNSLRSNIIQERFHSDPLIKASELLLHERFPSRIPLSEPHQTAVSYLEKQSGENEEVRTRVYSNPNTKVPRTHILSNDNLTTVIDNSGSGYVFFERDIALTRWREDPIANNHGIYVYIKDLETKKIWSATYQPTLSEPESYEVIFSSDKVEFKRKDNKILTQMEITVAQEDNVEIRRLNFTNLSGRRRVLEITSYGEVALNFFKADLSHPAFSKMFIESEYNPDSETIFFSRRPRSRREEQLHLFHTVLLRTCYQKTQFDSSRYSFIGRRNTIRNPQALNNAQLEGNSGLILDPAFSLRTIIEIEPHKSESVAYVTGISRNKEEIVRLSTVYKEFYQLNRAFEMSWSKSSVELRTEKFTAKQANLFQILGNSLIYSQVGLAPTSDIISKNRLTQSALWRFGISGDIQILLIKVSDPVHIKLVNECLLAHHYLRSRGFIFDLVILNEYPGGYQQHFNEEIEVLIKSMSSNLIDKKGGIFLRTSQQISSEEKILLQSVAKVILDGHDGLLETILSDIENDSFEPIKVNTLPQRTAEKTSPKMFEDNTINSKELEFKTAFGGFSNDGKSYFIKSDEKNFPPLPWSNVIAQKEFGTLITDSGAGYTWSGNSRENRITPWSNDYISDPLSEVIYIRDVETGNYWSPTPQPVNTDTEYTIEHSYGYSAFVSTYKSLSSNLTISISNDEKIKWYKLNLKNLDKTRKTLELYFYVDWVLGINKEDSTRFILTDFDKSSKYLVARNYYNNEFAGRCAFIGSSLEISGFTSDKTEFVGRNSDLSSPILFDLTSINKQTNLKQIKKEVPRLSKKVGAGFQQCGLIKCVISVNPEESKDILFFIGEVESIEKLSTKSMSYGSPSTAYKTDIKNSNDSWSSLTNKITVNTPSKAFDYLINGWLLYQTLSCRIYGRSAFYQSGGAFGFRDQLQDVLALLYIDPNITKEQIVLHAGRQFIEGDVQHWWHPPTGRGVRTKISDDYLWLPYVVSKYISVTGDYSILKEEAHYLDAPLLGEHAESYIVPRVSQEKGTILDHCIRAFNHSRPRGIHGLPLIGAGDWNDGMNEVGIEGKGESVWLAWFLSTCLTNFAHTIKESDKFLSDEYLRESKLLIDAIEQSSWDGRWYRRAYFDDGTPLGSISNEECQIDIMSQSWSIINGQGDPLRMRESMASVLSRLVDKKGKIIKLLNPPFNTSNLEPGYIKGYLPGVRENGGQYTHAAAWAVIAFSKLGLGSESFELFDLINPIKHTATDKGVNTYMGEPYVTCGDVYSVEPHVGRAGWSWYTGSAGWLYQAGIEYIIGLQIFPNYFTINPCIPHEWHELSVNYKRDKTEYNIQITNPKKIEKGIIQVLKNGENIEASGNNEFRITYDDVGEIIDLHIIMG